MDNKVLFTINGFEVREKSTYIIKDKPDWDAPTGFAERGITKVPSEGVAETFQCRNVRENGSQTGVWDTGFYPFSPCYRNQDMKIVEQEVEKLQKNLVEPYRRAVGNPEALSQNNEDFWLKQKFTIFTKKVFNTDSPISLLELYFALRTYQVCPKGSEKDPKFRHTSYIIVDQSKDFTVKNERLTQKYKAIGLFTVMLEDKKPTLLLVLNYMGLPFSGDVDNPTLIGMFDEALSVNAQRVDTFLNLVEEAKTEDGQAKLDIYKKLKALAGRGGKVTKTPSGVFFYDGEEIGPDLKQAAENIAKNGNLAAIRKEIVLGDDN